MDGKQIRIEPMIEPKASPKMERMIKQYGNLWQKATQFGDLAKGNKELDKRLKGMEKWISKDKELAKIMSQNSNKALEAQRVTLQNIGKEVDKNVQRYQNAEKTAAKWASRAASRAASRYADLGGTPDFVTRNIAQMQANMAERIRGGAGATIASGSEALQARMREEEQERASERQRKAWQIGQYMQAGAGIIQGVGNVFFGSTMRGLGYTAQQHAPAVRMYDEMTSGDYSTLLALGGSNSRDLVKNIHANQGTQTQMTLVAQGLGGLGQVLSGYGALQAGPAGAAASGAMGQGILGIAGAVMDAATGKVGADQATTTMQAIEFLKSMRGIQHKQFRALTGAAGQVTDLGNLAGGVGSDQIKRLMASAAAGGLTLDQAMPLFNTLRGASSNADATNMLAAATGATTLFGVNRNAATQSMAGFSGMAGGGPGAQNAMISTMAHAVRKGIVDSQLKEVFITTIPALVNSGIAARGGASDDMSAFVAGYANKLAANRGMAVDTTDINLAAQAASYQNQLFSGGGSISPINVARQAGVIRLANKYGISNQGKVALASLSQDDLRVMDEKSQIWKMLRDEEGMSDDEIRELRDSYLKVGWEAYDTAMGGFGDRHSIAGKIAVAKATGGRLEYLERVSEQSGGAGTAAEAALGKTGDQTRFDAQRIADAANLMHPLFAALSDEKMVRGLGLVTAQANSLTEAFSNLERTDPDKLKDLPALLGMISDSLELLGTAAANALGVFNNLGITLGTNGLPQGAVSVHPKKGGTYKAPSWAPPSSPTSTVPSH